MLSSRLAWATPQERENNHRPERGIHKAQAEPAASRMLPVREEEKWRVTDSLTKQIKLRRF